MWSYQVRTKPNWEKEWHNYLDVKNVLLKKMIHIYLPGSHNLGGVIYAKNRVESV